MTALLFLAAQENSDALSVFSTTWFWVVLVLLTISLALWWLIPHLRMRDIKNPQLDPNLSWEAANSVLSLQAVYDFVTEFADNSIGWYAKRRKPKRILGIFLRATAIILTAFAGLVPLLPEFVPGDPPAALSTLALALAALFVTLDHFGGFTSGWVRYMLAQQKIERLRQALTMDWNIWKAKAAGASQPDVQEGLTMASHFLVAVSKVIDDETKQWAAEFQSALKELERTAKEASETTSTGAIEVTLTNHDSVDGWTLEIEGMQRGSYTSPTAVVTNLLPRIHKVRAFGAKDGKRYSAEKAISVSSGSVESIQLTLA